MRATQVELECVSAGFFTQFGQLLPVLFVKCAHNACYDDLIREVSFQFSNALQPIAGELLRYQLDIEECAYFEVRLD